MNQAVGKITKKGTKKNGSGANLLIAGIDGGFYSGDAVSGLPFQEGDVVSFPYNVSADGKWKNFNVADVRAAEEGEKGTAPAAAPKKQGTWQKNPAAPADPNAKYSKDAYIVRQSSMKAAVDLVAGEQVALGQKVQLVKSITEELFKFIMYGASPLREDATQKAPVPQPEAPKAAPAHPLNDDIADILGGV